MSNYIFLFIIKKKQKKLINFSALFWIGDLNYRLDAESHKVKKLVANGKHLELLCCDQVIIIFIVQIFIFLFIFLFFL